MKKLILFILLCFHFVVLLAQQDVTTFLGIPVDGTKPEMIKKLKEKGFVYSRYSDVLRGEFNGEDVEIHIVTDNNKVWRIAVFDKLKRSEQQIKIRYNQLCIQFSNNNRYTSRQKVYTSLFPNLLNYSRIPYMSFYQSKDSSFIIPDNEDISHEMTVNEKLYQAIFYQYPDSATFFNNPIIQKECPNVYKMFLDIGYAGLVDTSNDAIKEYYRELSWDEKMDIRSEAGDIVFFGFNKSVWFQIFSWRYDEYSIVIYYDNKYNEANGEDL